MVADYNNFEMRLMGHFSQDPVILDAFANGLDLHVSMGAKLMGFTYEELWERYENGDPEAKKIRSLGKTMNFGAAYGIGARKLRRFILVNNQHELTLSEAERWLDEYNDLYAGAYAWKQRVWEFVRNNGYVVTLYGRKRRLPDAFSTDRGKRGYAERQATNVVIQGSAGDIISEAMVIIQPKLEALRGSLVLQCHDELVAQVPSSRVNEAKAILEHDMVAHANPLLRCELLVEASSGTSWGEAKG